MISQSIVVHFRYKLSQSVLIHTKNNLRHRAIVDLTCGLIWSILKSNVQNMISRSIFVRFHYKFGQFVRTYTKNSLRYRAIVDLKCGLIWSILSIFFKAWYLSQLLSVFATNWVILPVNAQKTVWGIVESLIWRVGWFGAFCPLFSKHAISVNFCPFSLEIGLFCPFIWKEQFAASCDRWFGVWTDIQHSNKYFCKHI